MRRWALLLVALAACRTDTAPRSSAPAQAPAATPVRTAEARPAVAGTTPSVAATTVVAAASDLPKFARPDADLEAEFPLRATIRTVGWTYETASGEGGVAGDGSSARSDHLVIDDGAATDPRRVRLLCQESTHRIAVYVDAHDLMVTVREQALMVARPKLPKRVHDRTPGVRIEPGAPLLVQHRPAQGLAFVRYEGDFVDAEGFVAVKALDVVYLGERAQWSVQPNAEVIHRARVYDRPAGHELARIAPSTGEDTRWVETLGPREGKWRLVRYEDEDVHVIGWIDKKHLRRRAGEVPQSWGGLIGTSIGRGNPIMLPRGTRLVGRSGPEVIGIVTDDHEFECVSECRSDEPLVQVHACTRPFTVRAVAKS